MPAAGRAAFTRLYDPVMALTMRERRWRPDLLRAVRGALPHGGTAVDVGAGTGTIAIALASAAPAATVVAVDGDPEILRLARRKPGAEAVDWREGTAQALPVVDGEADAVVMSLLLHHLVPEVKAAALTEARRVLHPGGRLFVADWGRPRGALARAGFAIVRLADGLEPTRDHGAGVLPVRIADAGFTSPRLTKRVPTAWGTLELMAAVRREEVGTNPYAA